MRRRMPALTLLLALAAAGCTRGEPSSGTGVPSADAPRGGASTTAPEPDVRVEVIASGLEHVWDIDFLPDGTALVTERPGRIRLLSGTGPGAAVSEVAADLGDEDALLIFPEGCNYTPHRRRRAIDALRHRGHDEYADRAERMAHVLPPRPGGVLAAMDAAPHADLVLVAHTGLEHITGARSAWRVLHEHKTLHLRWWFHAADEVPRQRDERIAWLFARWAEIDAWIADQEHAHSP